MFLLPVLQTHLTTQEDTTTQLHNTLLAVTAIQMGDLETNKATETFGSSQQQKQNDCMKQLVPTFIFNDNTLVVL